MSGQMARYTTRGHRLRFLWADSKAFRAQKQPILPDLVLFTKAQLVTALSIVVTGDAYNIIGELCRALEMAMRGNIVVDIEVRLNLKRGGV